MQPQRRIRPGGQISENFHYPQFSEPPELTADADLYEAYTFRTEWLV